MQTSDQNAGKPARKRISRDYAWEKRTRTLEQEIAKLRRQLNKQELSKYEAINARIANEIKYLKIA